MKKKLRDAWVKALRSGEYKQGLGRLQNGDAYCCIGVMCEVAKKIGFVSRLKRDADGELTGVGPGDQLKKLDKQISFEACTTLIEMNDGLKNKRKHPFPDIADWIEAHIKVES